MALTVFCGSPCAVSHVSTRYSPDKKVLCCAATSGVTAARNTRHNTSHCGTTLNDPLFRIMFTIVNASQICPHYLSAQSAAATPSNNHPPPCTAEDGLAHSAGIAVPSPAAECASGHRIIYGV